MSLNEGKPLRKKKREMKVCIQSQTILSGLKAFPHLRMKKNSLAMFGASSEHERMDSRQLHVLTATVKQQQQSHDCLSSYSATKLNKKRTTEIVNKLKITGKILCTLRGKEVAIGIADHSIGKLLQALFTNEEKKCAPADFESTSQLWLRFWSNNHGPVYSTQPVETGQVLDCFCQKVLALPPAQMLRIATIWTTMKEHQDVFNGFGAQESCDALFVALIHPLMPVTLLSGIPCYRREFVKLSTEPLTLAHNMGLFNKDAVLGDDGVARVPSIPFPPAHVEIKDVPLASRKGCHFVKVPNYIHRIEKYQNSSTSFLHVYSLFTCQLPSTWPDHNNIWSGIVDFTKSVNDSTLGPYSFKVFVDAAWT
ncbi:hypothetical protein EV359DRAFT_68817 [Lentinula novae-zelandiae]|nr:hypothetical protein EV359DRAFT_68817 [Lentinula novae-zelandiae]